MLGDGASVVVEEARAFDDRIPALLEGRFHSGSITSARSAQSLMPANMRGNLPIIGA